MAVLEICLLSWFSMQAPVPQAPAQEPPPVSTVAAHDPVAWLPARTLLAVGVQAEGLQVGRAAGVGVRAVRVGDGADNQVEVAAADLLVGFQLYQDIVVQTAWQWADLADIARTVLVLLIASIPVAMPTVITVTNSLGAQALARKKAIVSRLEAIEELAGVDILCSDKTGTLTKNILTLGDPILFEAKSPDDLILAGGLTPENVGPALAELGDLLADTDTSVRSTTAVIAAVLLQVAAVALFGLAVAASVLFASRRSERMLPRASHKTLTSRRRPAPPTRRSKKPRMRHAQLA